MLDEVRERYSTSGEYDVVLRVHCRIVPVYSARINDKLHGKGVLAIDSHIDWRV